MISLVKFIFQITRLFQLNNFMLFLPIFVIEPNFGTWDRKVFQTRSHIERIFTGAAASRPERTPGADSEDGGGVQRKGARLLKYP